MIPFAVVRGKIMRNLCPWVRWETTAIVRCDIEDAVGIEQGWETKITEWQSFTSVGWRLDRTGFGPQWCSIVRFYDASRVLGNFFGKYTALIG